MKKIIYHLHIPKTAGTSLRHLIKPNFENGKTFPYLLWYNYWKSNNYNPSFVNQVRNSLKYSFVSGHFGYNLDRVFYTKLLRRFTILRNPYDRCLSFYHHLSANTETRFFVSDVNGKIHEIKKPIDTIDSLLNNSVYKNIFNNIRTRYFAIDYNIENLYNRYPGIKDFAPDFAYDFIGEKLTQEHLDKAIERLEHTVVGIQEHFFVSQWLIREEFNLNFTINDEVRHMKHGNYTSYSSLSPVTQKLIESNNKIDLQLYDYAKLQFLKHVQVHAAKVGLTPPDNYKDLKEFKHMLQNKINTDKNL